MEHLQKVIAASIKNCYFWKHIKKYHLKLCQRTLDDPHFTETILDIGEGKIESQDVEGVSVIPLRDIDHVVTTTELIDFVFPKEILKDPDLCCCRAILSGTNATAGEFNDSILNDVEGESVNCFSVDTILNEDNNTCNISALNIESSLLNNISKSGVPDHKISLKIGAIVILIRNLSFIHALVNGTKLIVVNISRFFIEARAPNKNDTVLIPRAIFDFSIGNHGMEMRRRQFPLRLAYGLTKNKSQGQTLNRVGVDLRSDVFSHGQLYAALGRVRKSCDLKVLVPQQRVINNVSHTDNVVYEQLINPS